MLYELFDNMFIFGIICGIIGTFSLIISEYNSIYNDSMAIKLRIITTILYTIFIISVVCVSFIKVTFDINPFTFIVILLLTSLLIFLLFVLLATLFFDSEEYLVYLLIHILVVFISFSILLYNVIPENYYEKNSSKVSDYIMYTSKTRQICFLDQDLIKNTNNINDMIVKATESKVDEEDYIGYWYKDSNDSLSFDIINSFDVTIKPENSDKCYIDIISYGKFSRKNNDNADLISSITKYVIHMPKDKINGLD